MFSSETQILQHLAVLALCHGFAANQIFSRYFFVQKPMSWEKGRKFCQKNYVDLAILSTEQEYFDLLNTTQTIKSSFWLGLHRHSSGWKWTNGEELTYKRWYNTNEEGRCVSLEAMWGESDKLLARFCDEEHMIVCQGPVSPQSVSVDSVSIDGVNLSWNISALMQMTPHYYNLTICNFFCETLLYPYPNGSSLMTVSIINLTAATEYFIRVSAVVVHPDLGTNRSLILQDIPATLSFKTATSKKIQKILVLKLIKLVLLLLIFLIIYLVLKKAKSTENVQHRSSMESLAQDFQQFP